MTKQKKRSTVVAMCMAIFVPMSNSLSATEAGMEAYNKGDYSTALSRWTELARNGNGQAQYNLSLLYFNGQGTIKNDNVGLQWLIRAADSKHPDAQADLALRYYEGSMVSRDIGRAVNLWRSSYEQGNSRAAYNYAVQIINGRVDGVRSINAEPILQNLLKSDPSFSVGVNKMLGHIYDNFNFDRDVHESDMSSNDKSRLLGLSAKKWDLAIGHFLAHLDAGGRDKFVIGAFSSLVGMATTDARQLGMLKQLSAEGFSGSTFKLAKLSGKGSHVKTWSKAAIDLLNLAASQGSIGAFATLGEAYFAGGSVPRNLLKSKQMFSAAASDPDISWMPQSPILLGDMAVDGKYIGRDYLAALEMYNLAMRWGGVFDVKPRLAKLKPILEAEEKNNSESALLVVLVGLFALSSNSTSDSGLASSYNDYDEMMKRERARKCEERRTQRHMSGVMNFELC